MKTLNVVRTQDIALFFREFATLFSAGLPIGSCCDVMIENHHNTPLVRVVESIKHDLLSGHLLSIALDKHPSHFNTLSRHLVNIGEQTGKLDLVLEMIASTLENEIAFKIKIKQALFYPVIVLSLAGIISMIMLLFIIPRFAELFQHSFHHLPKLTLFIFNLSLFLRNYFIVMLFALTASGMLLYYYRPAWITFPRFTRLYTQSSLIRFTREFALAHAAGLPLPNAISLATPSQPSLFTQHLSYIASRLQNGDSLYTAMASTHYFPPLLLQLIRIGESSGTLDAMLNKAANLLETAYEHDIQRLAKLAEPLIMLVLGVVIGGLVIGMYLPIFNLGNAI